MNTYTYTGNYNNIEVQEILSEEGILNGPYGALHFKRCVDGFAVYNTAFPGSGFVSTPTDANIAYPSFINGVPVTEIHQLIKINGADPIAIEGRKVKRVFLSIARRSLKDEMSQDNSLADFFVLMLDGKERAEKESKPLEIAIDFYNENNAVEHCEIRCDEKCIITGISAKYLEITSPAVILKGKAYEFLERIKFTGRVYPYTYRDRYGEGQDTDYFANIKSLRSVEGSLHGNVCWSFKECTSLEQVHLANGILKIPPYAFNNCSSITDLYIPDTVSEMGEYAFAGCTKLARIHLPSDIKKISKGLFKNCSSLTKCYLSDNIEEIEDEAFMGCTALRKPWIPKGIKRIGETAFST